MLTIKIENLGIDNPQNKGISQENREPKRVMVFGANERGIHGGGLLIMLLKTLWSHLGAGRRPIRVTPMPSPHVATRSTLTTTNYPYSKVQEYVDEFIQYAKEIPPRNSKSHRSVAASPD